MHIGKDITYLFKISCKFTWCSRLGIIDVFIHWCCNPDVGQTCVDSREVGLLWWVIGGGGLGPVSQVEIQMLNGK